HQQIEMLEQNGLARSAGADDRRDLAGGKVQRNAVEDLLAAEAAAKIAHFDCITGARRVANALRIAVAMVDFSLTHGSSIARALSQEYRRKKIVKRKNKGAGQHHGFGGGAADPGRHPFGVISLVATDPGY